MIYGLLPELQFRHKDPNPDLENETRSLVCHCEHLKGACLHAVVPAFAETLRAGRRFGTQAWQSHWKRRDCFVSLAMTIP